MQQKRAMVTGASEGIGRAFAEALAARGYALTLVARRRSVLDEVAQLLPGTGHEVVDADLATPTGIGTVSAALGRQHVHLLVNNAGVGRVGGFCGATLAQQMEVVRVNVEALLALSHAFCARAAAGDTLINVSSILADAPQPSQPVYAASKAFVTSLSTSLWHEMRPRGVHVMAVQPGSTRTAFGQHAGRAEGWQRARWQVQTPDRVVKEALRAAKRRRGPEVTTGLHNAVFAYAARVLPRRLLVSLMSRAA